MNWNYSSVNGYTIDPSSGNLTWIANADKTFGAVAGQSSYTSGYTPLIIDPSGKFLYAISYQYQSMGAFQIDQTTGALTAIAGSPYAFSFSPVSLLISPDGGYLFVTLYAAANNVLTYSIDSTTGALSLLGTYSAGSGPEAIVIDPTGSYLYVGNNTSKSISIFSISNGLLTALPSGQPVNLGENVQQLIMDPKGKYLYAVTFNGATWDGSIYGFSIQADGTLAALAGSPYLIGFSGGTPYIAMDASTSLLFTGNDGSVGFHVFIISATGKLSQMTGSPLATTNGSSISEIAVDASNHFVYGGNANNWGLSGYSIASSNSASAISSSLIDTTADTHPRIIAITK